MMGKGRRGAKRQGWDPLILKLAGINFLTQFEASESRQSLSVQGTEEDISLFTVCLETLQQGIHSITTIHMH